MLNLKDYVAIVTGVTTITLYAVADPANPLPNTNQIESSIQQMYNSANGVGIVGNAQLPYNSQSQTFNGSIDEYGPQGPQGKQGPTGPGPYNIWW